VVDSHLVPAAVRSGGVVSAGDPSFVEHIRTVLADLRISLGHPLGQGLGSSGSSAIRFAGAGGSTDYAPGESAVLTMFVDTGVVGGSLYLLFYGYGIALAFMGLLGRRRQTWRIALPVVACAGGLALLPITLTSDLWGDFSVTFLFWWAIGCAASLAYGRARAEQPEAVAAVIPGAAST
jgi:hypothetical protein